MNFNDLDAYLNVHDQDEDRYVYLDELISNFVERVPFENINVQNGWDIALDNGSMLQKIINERRGGYCYENNRLFHEYLKSKGFESYLISAKINTPFGYWSREGSHMSIITVMDGEKFVTDVGFGDLPSKKIPLTKSDSISDVNGIYKAEYINETDFDVLKYDEFKDEWTILYRAKDIERNLEDFNDNIEYNRFNPDSIFVKRLIITKVKPYGRVTMSNNHVTITRDGQKSKVKVNGDNYQDLLVEYFDMRKINIKTFDV